MDLDSLLDLGSVLDLGLVCAINLNRFYFHGLSETLSMNTVSDRLKTLNRIRRFSRLMDTAIGIPGTKFRIGLDPIIGLLPGVGDLATTGLSVYVLVMAARFRLPMPLLRGMIFNVALEAVLGSIPVVGDVFDAFFKANIRNLAVLEQHLQESAPELQAADSENLSSVDPDFARSL
ncbi:MAG: DUF4112 domain-containing protein [Elainellaceae cyanobacterium]